MVQLRFYINKYIFSRPRLISNFDISSLNILTILSIDVNEDEAFNDITIFLNLFHNCISFFKLYLILSIKLNIQYYIY